MSAALPLPPRAWWVAAPAGAYAAIVPVALAAGGYQVINLRSTAAATAVQFGYTDPDAFGRAVRGGFTMLGGVLALGSLFGLPVAFLLAGVMAALERRHGAAHTLVAWLGASLLAVAPLGVLATFLFATWLAVLPFAGMALIGATVAWSVRHRPFAR